MNTYEKIKRKLDGSGVKYAEIDQSRAKSRSIEDLVASTNMTFKEGLATLFFINERNEIIAVLRRDDRNLISKEIKKITKSKSLNFASEQLLNDLGYVKGLASPVLLSDIQKERNITILVDRKAMEMTRVICGIGKEGIALEIQREELFTLIGRYTIADITVPNDSRQAGIRKRILTGDTPSGKLHIGHFVGTLENRVKMQDEYETYILLANVHAYANYFEKSELINQNVYDVFLDNLAVGIDPKKSTIYLESGIPETYELYSFFLTMVTHGRAMRNPSVKDEIRYKKLDPTLGFVCYPILQAADILQFNASIVPVGEDQMAVIEQSREIARDFNKAYGNLFTMPEGLVGRVARLVGTDGKEKMSKSGHNAILLSETKDSLKQKVMSMYTDPTRIKSTDKGNVKDNPVFVYHEAFNTNKEEVADLKERYENGKVGDVEVKEKLFLALDKFLDPIREKRKYYEERPKEAKEILIAGTQRARKVVQNTVESVRELVGINKLISE